MFAEHVDNFQLTLFDDDVQGVGIELDPLWVLHVMVDQQTVRQSRSKLEADLATKPQLESFNRVAVDLDERVVLRKHKFLLRLLLLSLFEDQLVALRLRRLDRVLRLIRFLFDVRHVFTGQIDVAGRSSRHQVRRQSVYKEIVKSRKQKSSFDSRFPPMQWCRHSISVSNRF